MTYIEMYNKIMQRFTEVRPHHKYFINAIEEVDKEFEGQPFADEIIEEVIDSYED